MDGVTSSEELKSQLVEALHAVEQVQSELAKVAEEKEQVEVKVCTRPVPVPLLFSVLWFTC